MREVGEADGAGHGARPMLPSSEGRLSNRAECILRHAMEEAREAFLGVLDGYTLEDLQRPRESLRGLLKIIEPGSARPAVDRI